MKPALSHSLVYLREEKICSGLKQTFWNTCGKKNLKNQVWKFGNRILVWHPNPRLGYGSAKVSGLPALWWAGEESKAPGTPISLLRTTGLVWDLRVLPQGALKTSHLASEAFSQIVCRGPVLVIWHWIWQVPTLPLVGVWNWCIPTDVLIYMEFLVFSNNKIFHWNRSSTHNYDVLNHRNGSHISKLLYFR